MTTHHHLPAKLRCSVGVTAYNEEHNIGQLLAALLDQHLHEVEITEIVVVASGVHGPHCAHRARVYGR